MIEKKNTTTGENVKYYYDAENMLVLVESKTGATLNYRAKYAYDPEGRRVVFDLWKGSSMSRKYLNFFYDGDDVIAEYVGNVTAETGTPTAYSLYAHYLHGPDVDEPLVWWKGTADASGGYYMKPSLYHVDGLGSVTAITGLGANVWNKATPASQIMASYIYNAYGNQVSLCGDLASLNRYRYTSREWDDYNSTSTKMVGLGYHRARYADYNLGTFTSEDPKWDTNLYPYVGNGPVMNVDPMGEVAWKLVGKGSVQFVTGVVMVVGGAAGATTSAGATIFFVLSGTPMAAAGVTNIISGFTEGINQKSKKEKAIEVPVVSPEYVVIVMSYKGRLNDPYTNLYGWNAQQTTFWTTFLVDSGQCMGKASVPNCISIPGDFKEMYDLDKKEKEEFEKLKLKQQKSMKQKETKTKQRGK